MAWASSRKRWSCMETLPDALTNGNAIPRDTNQLPAETITPIQPPKLPLRKQALVSDQYYGICQSRIRYVIQKERGYLQQFCGRIESAARMIMEAFKVEEIIEVLDDSLLPYYREWLNEDFLEYNDGILSKHEQTWMTSDAGAYLWQIGGESKVTKAVRYIGTSWGPGGIFFRVSTNHQNSNHRKRVLETTGSLIYEYAEGLHDGYGKRSIFVCLGTIRRDGLSQENLKGWCLILETTLMVLNKTFAASNSLDIPLFAAMCPEGLKDSPYAGANKIPSIRVYSKGGSSSQSSECTVSKKVASLIRVWKEQKSRPVKRLQGTEILLEPSMLKYADKGKTHRVNVGDLGVGIPAEITSKFVLKAGVILTVILDVVESGCHSNPWIIVPPEVPESSEAMKLGIAISGTSRDRQRFAVWIRRQLNNWVAGIQGHPSCNAAMSIIEWMRGEEIVPIPANRVRISKENYRLSNYWGKEDDVESLQKNQPSLLSSENGREVLRKFEDAKKVSESQQLQALKGKGSSPKSNLVAKSRKSKAQKQIELMDKLHPAEVVGTID